jgi:hypothetical protein
MLRNNRPNLKGLHGVGSAFAKEQVVFQHTFKNLHWEPPLPGQNWNFDRYSGINGRIMETLVE